jgi:hypothetical protein
MMDLLNYNKKYTKTGKLIVFLVLVCVSGLPWWLTNYQMYINNANFSIYSVIILAIAAGYIKYKTNHGIWETLFVVMSSHQVALIIKFIKDGIEDPTNHNLAPFEMIIFLMVDFIIFLITLFIVDQVK